MLATSATLVALAIREAAAAGWKDLRLEPGTSQSCVEETWKSLPRQYVAYYTEALQPSNLDADLTKAVWAEVPWTSDFVDIATSTAPRFRTRAKMRWDNAMLYIAAELEEPNAWATLLQHDSVIFNDNDFEIFIDPAGSTHNYTEFEMNSYNTTWDLRLNKPYGDGGSENSRRVNKTHGFEMQPPLRSAVSVNGSLNDPNVGSHSWSVEVAVPFTHTDNRRGTSGPPKAGDVWRINFSRVQWAVEVKEGKYVKKKSCQSCAAPGSEAEDNWAWSPQGQVAMHLPERWGLLQFATGPVGGTEPTTYSEWPARAMAAGAYYAQHAHAARHNGSFATDPSELLLFRAESLPFPVCPSNLHIELGDGGKSFSVTATDPIHNVTVSVHDDRLTLVVP